MKKLSGKNCVEQLGGKIGWKLELKFWLESYIKTRPGDLVMPDPI